MSNLKKEYLPNILVKIVKALPNLGLNRRYLATNPYVNDELVNKLSLNKDIVKNFPNYTNDLSYVHRDYFKNLDDELRNMLIYHRNNLFIDTSRYNFYMDEEGLFTAYTLLSYFTKYFMSNIVPDSIFDKYHEYIIWEMVSTNPYLSAYILDKYSDKLNWSRVSLHNINITRDIVDKYHDKIEWNFVKLSFPIDLDFVKKYKHYINWFNFSKSANLTSPVIEKYMESIFWSALSENTLIDLPKLIGKFEKKWVWRILSKNPLLTSRLIIKYLDNIDWRSVSLNPNLTLDLIETFSDRLDKNLLALNCFYLDDAIDLEKSGVVDIILKDRETKLRGLRDIGLCDDIVKYILQYYL